METIHTAYTRVVNDVNFYFVKRYTVFSEYDGAPKILEDFGMHRDFYKACSIAKIYDKSVVHQLLNDLHILPETARVVPMNPVKSTTLNLIKNTYHAISKFRLAGIN